MGIRPQMVKSSSTKTEYTEGCQYSYYVIKRKGYLYVRRIIVLRNYIGNVILNNFTCIAAVPNLW